MAFCVDCGKPKTGQNCESCQASTVVSARESKASVKQKLPAELRRFRNLVLVYFLGIAPLLFTITIFTMFPKDSDDLSTSLVWWFIFALAGAITILPLRWIKKGSWKARRRAAWLFLALGLIVVPSSAVPDLLRLADIIVFWAFFYFTLRGSLNAAPVKALVSDYQDTPSWRKRKIKSAVADPLNAVMPSNV